MPNATTNATAPEPHDDATTGTTIPATLGAGHRHPRQPEGEARRAAVAVEPSELEQTRADLLELAETSDGLRQRAEALGLRATARRLKSLSKMLRACRARITYQPSHVAAGQAYVLTAVDTLTAAAVSIGAHAQQTSYDDGNGMAVAQ